MCRRQVNRNGSEDIGRANTDDDAHESGQQRVAGALANELLDELERRCPTARAIPISGRRSAASIVKIRTISSMPAAMEKRPRTMKMPVKAELIPCAARGNRLWRSDTEPSAFQERSNLILGGIQFGLGLFDGTVRLTDIY